MRIQIVRTHEDLPLPAAAFEGDAGLDLRASHSLSLSQGQVAGVSTGIAVAIPDGCLAFVVPRSGLALSRGVTVLNAPGLIDSGYRGEIQAIMINLGSEEFAISRGDRVAQLVVLRYSNVEWDVVSKLPSSHRGAGGLGTSGLS